MFVYVEDDAGNTCYIRRKSINYIKLRYRTTASSSSKNSCEFSLYINYGHADFAMYFRTKERAEEILNKILGTTKGERLDD